MGTAALSLQRYEPGGSQKAKALWAMKAASDRGEEQYDPARKEEILGRTTTRLELWEEHLKDPAALAKALECLENPYLGWHVFHSLSLPASICRRNGFQHRWRKDFARDVGRAPLGRRLAFLDPWDVVGLRTTSGVWTVPAKYGPHGELFSVSSGRILLLLQRQWGLSPLFLRRRSRHVL